MVWLKNLSGRKVFVCDSCGLGYADAKIALSCERHCKESRSCELDIAKKAIYRP